MFSNFLSEFVSFMRKYGKFVEPERPQMTIGRMHIVCWISEATSTQPQKCNTYCFYTATVVARELLSITFYLNCLPSFNRADRPKWLAASKLGTGVTNEITVIISVNFCYLILAS
jgi:hypothetical protein